MNVQGQWYGLPWTAFPQQGQQASTIAAAGQSAPIMTAAVSNSPQSVFPTATAASALNGTGSLIPTTAASATALSSTQPYQMPTAYQQQLTNNGSSLPATPGPAVGMAAGTYNNKLILNGLQQPHQQQQAALQQQLAAQQQLISAAGNPAAAFLNPYTQGLLTTATPQNLHPLLAQQQLLTSNHAAAASGQWSNMNQQAVAAQAAVFQAAAQQLTAQQQQLHQPGSAGMLGNNPFASLPLQAKVPLLRAPRMITKVRYTH